MYHDVQAEQEAGWFWREASAHALHEPCAVSAPSEPLALELTVRWRAYPLQIKTLSRARQVTLGAGHGHDIVAECPELGERWTLPLLSAGEHGQWRLHLHACFETTFERNGQRLSLNALFFADLERADRFAAHRELDLTAFSPDQGRFALHLGEIEIEIASVIAPKVTPSGARVDVAPLPYIALSAALHAVMLLTILALPAGIELSRSSLFEQPEPDRMIRARVVSPEPRRPLKPAPLEAPHRVDLQGDGEEATLSAAHLGASGRAGAEPTSNARRTQRLEIASPRPDPERPVRLAAARRDEVITPPSPAGALAALRSQEGFLGAAQDLSESFERAKRGNLRDADVGRAQGDFGLGVSGAGRGAGAHELSVGIALDEALAPTSLGAQGVAVRERERGLKTDDVLVHEARPEASPRACLTRDMVGEAVSRRRSQIRSCYEHHLLRDRSLSGQLSVEFTITQRGVLEGARVTSSTFVELEELEACVIARLETLRFPASSKSCGQITARYPFSFHPKQLLVLP